MLQLRDVALCAVTSTHLDLTARALAFSAAAARFGDAVLLSHERRDGPFRWREIPRLDGRSAYSRFVLRDLARHVSCPFALIVQWDGYVRDASAWRPEFLEYDYVGARWPWHLDGRAVGNGGFSLRSRRLLDAASELGLAPASPDENEDDVLCRRERERLERERSVRFAPEWLADRFSYEWADPAWPSFGFHGLRNFWREVPDAEMATEVAPLLDPRAASADANGNRGVDPFFVECLVEYARQRRHAPFRALWRTLRRSFDANEAYVAVANWSRDPGLALEVCRMGERRVDGDL